MPAVMADPLTLPRLPLPAGETDWRRVAKVVTAKRHLEGEGFQVRRPFPGIDLSLADPFLLLDHMGAVEYAPGEAKGTPWRTAPRVRDGHLHHRRSVPAPGHDRRRWPHLRRGHPVDDGRVRYPAHRAAAARVGHQGRAVPRHPALVNLPRAQKVQPRYQDIEAKDVKLLAADDGSSLVRVIAGSLAGYDGPGVTYTPINYLHATVAPGARLRCPGPRDFNALVYVLSGRGTAGVEEVGLDEGQLAVFAGPTTRATATGSSSAPPTPSRWPARTGGRS